jgi:hypothetical protein
LLKGIMWLISFLFVYVRYYLRRSIQSILMSCMVESMGLMALLTQDTLDFASIEIFPDKVEVLDAKKCGILLFSYSRCLCTNVIKWL